MNIKLLAKWLVPALLGAMITAAGCSGNHESSESSKLAGEATFDAVPADPSTIEAQLKRFKGQTRFLTPAERYWGRVGLDRNPSAARNAAADGSREIQESDIFKVGKPGSKLLYLLNNYRGLQVVSYAAGQDSPELLGRVEATGNWPDDMYFDAAHDRLIVLENNYQSDEMDAYDYSVLQSRLVVYDVSSPEAPRIVQATSLQGTLSESRMVGSVLYVATSVRPSYSDRQAGKSGNGYVYSFSLAASAEVAQIDHMELAAPVSWGANMNVVEVRKGEGYAYYLIAVLSKDSWSFWGTQSIVQVVDISSDEGKIAPVMVVTAKGVVNERSQTSVKNDTLIVASNYLSDADDRIQRVAVETFRFPTAASEKIDENEAQFRRLLIERSLRSKEAELRAAGISGDELEDQLLAYRETLTADPETGLKGRFIQQGTTLVKPLADSAVTIGNTQGLSASLQDVRFHGDLLYVYWVPSNNIDPLDIFDVAAPEAGVRHLAHLEFEGWIQRAVPMTYNGKDYVLGLGWIVPSVNNEQQRRYPQAVLFEVKKFASGAVRAQVVAQKNLQNSNTWANFNAEDKMIEIRSTGDGAGVIMYTFSSWNDGHYIQGGKLIGFDLSQVYADPDLVFAEGGVLSGSDSWLRRVFTNPEIDRINTFADEALATYNMGTAIGAASQIVEASHVLELARNIRAYETLSKDAVVRGVQVVSDYSWGIEDGKTELRLVDSKHADAEKVAVASTVVVRGTYVDSIKTAENAMMVLTQSYDRVPNGDGFDYKYIFTAARIALNGAGALELTGTATWEHHYDQEGLQLGYQQKLIQLDNGRVLAAISGTITELVAGDNTISTAVLPLTGCNVERDVYANLTQLSGKLFLSYFETVNDPQYASLRYHRDFVAPVSLEGSSLMCGAAVNIPGQPLAVTDGHIVTDDTRMIDLVLRGEDENIRPEAITEKAIASLKLDGGMATLADLYDPKDVSTSSIKVLNGDTLVFVESTARTAYWFAGMIGRPGIRWPGMHTETENRLVILSFDDELDFTKQAYVLDLPLNVSANLQAVFTSDRAEEGYLAVLSQSQRISLVSFNGVSRPVARKLARVLPDMSVSEAEDSVRLNSFWYWYDSSVHFTGTQRTLEIPQGMFGVAQLVIAE